MRVIATLSDGEGLEQAQRVLRREAARGILLQDGHLRMRYFWKNGNYTFPGGGVQAGETPQEALIREVREACGAVVTAVGEACGQISERFTPQEADYEAFCMVSHYYVCQVHALGIARQLEAYEQAIGRHPVWVTITDALRANHAVLTAQAQHAPRWIRRESVAREAIRRHLLDTPADTAR